jgi:hypothetical protein
MESLKEGGKAFCSKPVRNIDYFNIILPQVGLAVEERSGKTEESLA